MHLTVTVLEQREKAGLLRPGASNSSTSAFMSSLKTPSFHRSPSSPALGDAYDGSKDACSMEAVLEGHANITVDLVVRFRRREVINKQDSSQSYTLKSILFSLYF